MARPCKEATTKLQKRREYIGLTRAEAAKLAEIPYTTLKCWEYEYRQPKISGLKKLAKIYNCKIDDLVD